MKKKRRLPDKIRIGPYTFTREYRGALLDGDDKGADGLCSVVKQQILIRADLSEQYERVVRLHEVLHAIFWERGLPERPTEEQVCEAFSTALCAAYPDFDP